MMIGYCVLVHGMPASEQATDVSCVFGSWCLGRGRWGHFYDLEDRLFPLCPERQGAASIHCADLGIAEILPRIEGVPLTSNLHDL